MRDADQPFADTNLFNKYGSGSLGDVYQTPEEMNNLMQTLIEQFPEAIR